jgi:hypothetical protein
LPAFALASLSAGGLIRGLEGRVPDDVRRLALEGARGVFQPDGDVAGFAGFVGVFLAVLAGFARLFARERSGTASLAGARLSCACAPLVAGAAWAGQWRVAQPLASSWVFAQAALVYGIGFWLAGRSWAWLGALAPVTRRWLARAAAAGLVVLVALKLSSSVFTSSNLTYAVPDIGHHLLSCFDEFAAALNGRTPGAGYVPQYQHVLPWAAAPLFRAWGLTVLHFSLFMTALSAIALAMVYSILRRIEPGFWKRAFLYLAFLGACFLSLHGNEVSAVTSFNFFQMWPLRMAGPVAVAWLLGRRGVSAGLWGFAAAIALNSVDFGVSAWLALLSAALWERWRSGRSRAAVLREAARAVGIFALVAGAYALWVRVASGQFPESRGFLFYPALFGRLGFHNLPMPALGLHWLFLLTHLAALATGLLSGKDGKARPVDRFLVYFGAFGVLTFSYFAARSSQGNLVCLAGPWAISTILLFLRTDGANLPGPRGAVQATLGLQLTLLCLLNDPTTFLLDLRRFELRGGSLPARVDALVDATRAQLSPGAPKALILYPLAHFVGSRLGVVNVAPTQYPELFLKAGVEEVMRVIERHGLREVFGMVPTELAAELTRAGFARKGAVEGLYGPFETWARR